MPYLELVFEPVRNAVGYANSVRWVQKLAKEKTEEVFETLWKTISAWNTFTDSLKEYMDLYGKFRALKFWALSAK